MTEQTISVRVTPEVRAALLGESDISTELRAALELPGGGQPTAPFPATLTRPIAEQLRAKCRQLGFAKTALDIQIELLKNHPK